MSNLALTWAWSQQVEDPAAKLLLIKLADQANDDGMCWPSRRTLCEHIGLKTRALVYKLRTLEAAGLLTVRPRRRENGAQQSNVYCLTMHPPRAPACTPPVHEDAPLEPSVEPEVEANASTSCAEPKPRKRNLIWDALDAIWGKPANEVEKARRTRVVKLIRQSLEADGIPDEGALEEIERRREAYLRRWDGISAPTEIALASRWSDCKPLTRTGKPKQSRSEQARTWVKNVGWHYPNTDLREELAKRGLEGDEVQALLYLAESLRPGTHA